MLESSERINFGEKEKKEGDTERKEELTEKEKKIFEGTFEYKVLSRLREKSLNYAGQIEKETGVPKANVGLAEKRLMEAGVIEAEKKTGTTFVKEIHLDKLRNILEKTSYYRIYEFIEKNQVSPPTEISKKLKLDFDDLKEGINYLEDSSLIRGFKKGKGRFFYTAEYPEKDVVRKIAERKKGLIQQQEAKERQ